MAAAQIRAREHLQILKLPVIMQLQDQPLPQPPNTIHNVACAPFQAITFGDALLLCSSSLHPLWHLITFKSMHRAHQQLKLRHARDLSPSFCTSCSLTLFDPAKFLVDSLDFRQVMYPFVKSVDPFVPCTCSQVSCCLHGPVSGAAHDACVRSELAIRYPRCKPNQLSCLVELGVPCSH